MTKTIYKERNVFVCGKCGALKLKEEIVSVNQKTMRDGLGQAID